MEKDSRNNIKTFDKQFRVIFITTLLLMVSFLSLPYFFTTRSWFNIDFSKTGNIGDTIGGITAPFIAIVASILTFLAFWIQYKANEQQKIDLKIERFENKFYNLIDIHRSNVNDLSIGVSTKGRKAFVSLFNELKFTFLCVTNCYNKLYKPKHPDFVIDESNLYNISYLIFFFGVGPNSNKVVIDLIGENYEDFFNQLVKFIEDKKKEWDNKKTVILPFKDTFFELKIKYKPCGGHSSKLSHYVRNLFQIVKFLHEQDEKIIPYERKFEYARTLRSQLSTYEQLLIYYNSLSIMGSPWIDEKLIEDYCIIKSIPIPIADFYIKPQEKFKNEKNEKGHFLFEWNEIKERVKMQNKD